MILRKPYAFLIKNFRIIHLGLTLLIAYLFIKTYNIYAFFNRYVNNVYSALNDSLPTNYISVLMFFITILIVSFSLAMYLLMKQKKKPKTLYVWLCSYYVVYFLATISYFLLFKSMETRNLEIQTAMILRDITLILFLPQVVFLITSLIRGIGFDIRKFNFSKDLKELDIKESDSEEFEFVLGLESYKYFRFARRKFREFKYYVLENKFIFTILCGLFLGIFVMVVIINYTVFNRSYQVNQKFTVNNLKMVLNSSYLTNLDYNGNIIDKDKYYVIVNFTFTNDSGNSTVLDLTKYSLKTKVRSVYPILTKNEAFIDLGMGYNKEKIINGKSENYILVYEISKKEISRKYKLDIINGVEYARGSLNAKTKRIGLKPKRALRVENRGSIKLNKKLELNDTVLNNSYIQLNSYKLDNQYLYNYEACVRAVCSDMTDVVTADLSKGKTLMIVKGKLDLDKNSSFVLNRKNKNSFFDSFISVNYDGNESRVKDLTPSFLNNEYILEVDNGVLNANKINMLITIRNKKYEVALKGW